MDYEDQAHPISILARRQRWIRDLRSAAPPSDVKVYDANHKYLRTEPATFFETLVYEKRRHK